MLAKNMAKSPSTTITMKMDFTTDEVTCRPKRLGGALHAQALDGGDQADDQRHEGRLDETDEEGVDVDHLLQRWPKAAGLIPP